MFLETLLIAMNSYEAYIPAGISDIYTLSNLHMWLMAVEFEGLICCYTYMTITG